MKDRLQALLLHEVSGAVILFILLAIWIGQAAAMWIYMPWWLAILPTSLLIYSARRYALWLAYIATGIRVD